jgi:hypothetical protein
MKIASWPLFFLSCVVFAANTVELPDLLDPAAIHVDGNRMYITEHATIYIYSTKDYHLIKKFGRRGEGPKEFKLGQANIFLPGTFISFSLRYLHYGFLYGMLLSWLCYFIESGGDN